MFLKHDTIDVKSAGEAPPKSLRVVWSDQARGFFAYVDAGDEKSWPMVMSIAEGEGLVSSKIWEWSPGTMPVFPDDRDLDEHVRAKRDEDWALIAPILAAEPAVYVKMERAAMVKARTDETGVSAVTIKKHLLRAFHGGMSAGALLPRWDRCGAPGQVRELAPEAVKRGRPRKYGSKAGVNVTPEIRSMFLAAHSIYGNNSTLKLEGAYQLCMQKFFSREVEEMRAGLPGRAALDDYARSGLPTYEQFRYWIQRDADRIRAAMKRLGKRVYEMRNRALLDNSTNETWGPCARWQIDATKLDLYPCSRWDRSAVLERPTLYVVIDVFSRMIVGIYISLEHPSWTGAMMALANAVADKVEYCRGFGIEIEADDWPCRHIPAAILGDRGEMESAQVDHVLERFQIGIENAAPYRADWKGIVEQRFRILQENFAPYVHGYVRPDFRERGARDYRLDAVLTIHEITRIVIRQVLYYNNWNELSGYPRSPGMIADRVPAVPREIWRWGIANRSGVPRAPRQDLFRFALLPRSEATVHPDGIFFNGLYYTFQRAVDEGWFTRARRKTFSQKISYDKRYIDEIYVHGSKPGTFDVARLTPACRDRAEGMTFWEFEESKIKAKDVSADRRDEQTLARAAMEAANAADVAEAKAKLDGQIGSGRDGGRLKGMKENSSAEREADRRSEAEQFTGPLRPNVDPDLPEEGAAVLPLRPGPSAYDLPSMSRRRGNRS